MINGSKQSDDMKARKDETIPPVRPDLQPEKQVVHEQCGETYKEKEIKCAPKTGKWVCKHQPKCDSMGNCQLDGKGK